MAVQARTWKTTEEHSWCRVPAVELDGGHLDRGDVADAPDDVDLLEQQVHPHSCRSSNRPVTGSWRFARPTRAIVPGDPGGGAVPETTLPEFMRSPASRVPVAPNACVPA